MNDIDILILAGYFLFKIENPVSINDSRRSRNSQKIFSFRCFTQYIRRSGRIIITTSSLKKSGSLAASEFELRAVGTRRELAPWLAQHPLSAESVLASQSLSIVSPQFLAVGSAFQ
jgi:hypothetical protein